MKPTITNIVNVWSIALEKGNGYEFRQDVYFTFGNKRWVVDYIGIRHFDFLKHSINYN